MYTRLAGAVFAAVVPNNADKPLQEVIEEIMGDHEMMIIESSGSLSLLYVRWITCGGVTHRVICKSRNKTIFKKKAEFYV
ncbi:hypothetical protein Hdeb2414_s0027g00693161 [Helianthus debilis subsp. tardiflorus]